MLLCKILISIAGVLVRRKCPDAIAVSQHNYGAQNVPELIRVASALQRTYKHNRHPLWVLIVPGNWRL